MDWRDRAGNTVPGETGKDRRLQFLYGTGFGRLLVKVLICPPVSKAAGWLMDTKLSALAIKPFLKKSRINMDEYEQRSFRSFNDFFTRRILEGKRPVDMDPAHLIAPCDSKLSVYPITEDARFTVKEMPYTVSQLLGDEKLARRYCGGQFLLFRLTVDDYHRYSYIDSGAKGENIHIDGVFHTVNPAAGERYPIYKENTREYTLIETERFGTVLQMEVGATLVGRIRNDHGPMQVRRGSEKGRFEFGGSTVIVCLEPGRALIDEDSLGNTREGVETVVKLGTRIGIACD